MKLIGHFGDKDLPELLLISLQEVFTELAHQTYARRLSITHIKLGPEPPYPKRNSQLAMLGAECGLEGIGIGETLSDPQNPVTLTTIKVKEPTVRMTFGVNTSPFTGREGKWGTYRHSRDRLRISVCESVF